MRELGVLGSPQDSALSPQVAEVLREENFSSTEPMSNLAETGASGTPSGDTRNGSRIFITPYPGGCSTRPASTPPA